MDGDLLLEADDNVLKELGVSSALDRKKNQNKIQVVCQLVGCTMNRHLLLSVQNFCYFSLC